jgi:hypothetical protein
MDTAYLRTRSTTTKWGEVFFTGCYYSFDSGVRIIHPGRGLIVERTSMAVRQEKKVKTLIQARLGKSGKKPRR